MCLTCYSVVMGDSHKNDIPSFQRFLEKFCERIEKRTDEDDDVPIRLAPSFLVESEIEGECLDWLLQFLQTNKCPSALATSLSRCVCDEVLQTDLSELFEEGESFHSTESDLHVEKTVPQIECRQLAKVVFTHLYSVCERWNGELPEIPVPGRHFEVYSHAIKNTRRKMEDRHVILPDLNTLFKLENEPSQSYYAVFDGHGGVEAAIYTASHLHCSTIHHPDYNNDAPSAIRHAYNITDNMFLEKAQREGLRSGSTCVTALLKGDMLHLAWLGDSQAVLVKGGQLYDVMNPHKPERADEKKRIEDLGGVVVWFGTWRVNGNIAVSRAIGDIEHKPYISGEPDILSMELDGTEDYLILGCDGVWDTIPKEELPEIMYTYLQECEGDRTMVAQRLVSIARDNGSTDNISVVIIFFKDQISEPKPVKAAVEETTQPEKGEDEKGGNSDGKENNTSELCPPNSSSEMSNSFGNGSANERKCNTMATENQGSRKSRRDLSNTTRNREAKQPFKNRKKKVEKAEPQKVSQTEPSRKPLRSSSHVNTHCEKKTRSKSCTSRSKKSKSKTETNETVWAFTGKTQPRVQNHRLNQHAQINKKMHVSLAPSSSYLSKDWLGKTMARILEKRQHNRLQKNEPITMMQDDTALPWYALNKDDDLEPAADEIVDGPVVCGNQSTLHQNKGRQPYNVSGLKYQHSINRSGLTSQLFNRNR